MSTCQNNTLAEDQLLNLSLQAKIDILLLIGEQIVHFPLHIENHKYPTPRLWHNQDHAALIDSFGTCIYQN